MKAKFTKAQQKELAIAYHASAVENNGSPTPMRVYAEKTGVSPSVISNAIKFGMYELYSDIKRLKKLEMSDDAIVEKLNLHSRPVLYEIITLVEARFIV